MRFYQLLVQESLAKHFRSVINAAITSDARYSIARNLEVSKAKQAEGETAILNINALRIENLTEQYSRDQKSNTLDEFIKLKFEIIVNNYEKHILKIIELNKIDNVGSSSDAIKHAKKIIEDCMQICKDLNLLDSNYNEISSLCIFQAQVANYLSSKINTTIEPLTSEKITMVKEVLSDSIELFNLAKERPLAQLKHITKHIKEAITNNIKLCKARTKGFNIPILSTGFLSIASFNLPTKVTPSEGTLKIFLDVALVQLEQLEKLLIQKKHENKGSKSNVSDTSQLVKQSVIFMEAPAVKPPHREPKTNAELQLEELVARLNKPTPDSEFTL